MAFERIRVLLGLGGRGIPDNPGVSGHAKVGNVSLEDGQTYENPRAREYGTADILAVVKIAAAANGNVATLTLGTGAVAQTTGNPLINGVNAALAGAVDFEGDAQSALVSLGAIRLRTKSTNTGTVTLTGSSSGKIPAITLHAGADLVLSYPAAMLAASGTMIATFSASGDEFLVEYLGKSS